MCSNREKLIELICDGTLKTEICTTDTHLECDACRGDCGYCTILADHLIANGVTVQKHGEWIKSRDDYFDSLALIECSLCHEEWCFEVDEDVELLNYNYCPNCGAYMSHKGTENV